MKFETSVITIGDKTIECFGEIIAKELRDNTPVIPKALTWEYVADYNLSVGQVCRVRDLDIFVTVVAIGDKTVTLQRCDAAGNVY